ncbi:MAG: PD-(D/E)XK nuclease family protein [Legionella sp.]|uniref:PD-(D/E)XK nuclease family protein n=1 Tax=Legionella sp. TaxID=459 RepID=UPI0039E4882A
MRTLDDKAHLFALLAEGITVITPNNRLSESIIQQYFNYCGDKTINKPRCLPYSVMLVKAYEELSLQNPKINLPILLNASQSQYLWRNTIKKHPQLTYSEGLLDSIISAWEWCEQWQVDSEDASFFYTPQTRQFQQWWQSINQQLKQGHLITENQLVPYLIQAKSQLFAHPIVWVCFDDFSPQQKSLQQYLHTLGLEQYRYELSERSTKPQLLAAKDDQQEYQQLIAWIRVQLNAGAHQIGVVVPDLQQKSHLLQRILAQHFDTALFNISLGQALSEFPLVAHALCWLNLEDTQLTHHQAALLLQSPYLSGSQKEFIKRSEYLQDSTLLEEQMFSLKAFIHDLEPAAERLASSLKKIKAYPKEASVHEWIDLFQERLNDLGFPGDYGLNSENYQCFNRFALLFDELRLFYILNPCLKKTEALTAIKVLADQTIFQAQKTGAFIHVSGLLEASGCEFDRLWVMGLTDQCLPQKVHLSAFIPPQLQRELSMPHSLPARELHYAQQILQRFQYSSDEIVFSFAELQGDNPNLPCSLIANYPPFKLLPIAVESSNQELCCEEENYSIALKIDETISGGTTLLANQAKCPFKAFAEHRLRAKASAYTNDGFNAKERGQIIHKIMELLWQKIKNHQTLSTLDRLELDGLIAKTIHTVLSTLQQKHPESFSTVLQEIEHTRLKHLAQNCLEWEKQRIPFQIGAIEQSYTINFAGLDFQVRVDRLDQVAGKKWVIDYKSSLPGSKPWNEERPKEPQLLLYALLDEQINALLLMQLKTGKIKCSGFSEEKQDIAGIAFLKKGEAWEEYRTVWHQQLTLLAEEFQQGHCPPQPDQPAICQYCDYRNLCRYQTNE